MCETTRPSGPADLGVVRELGRRPELGHRRAEGRAVPARGRARAHQHLIAAIIAKGSAVPYRRPPARGETAQQPLVRPPELAVGRTFLPGSVRLAAASGCGAALALGQRERERERLWRTGGGSFSTASLQLERRQVGPEVLGQLQSSIAVFP
jgi:hypothetical protein